MEAEPQTFHHVGAGSPHSRTLTPTTAVRPRPRPPMALSARSQSIEQPPGGDAATNSAGVDDLAGALSELGRTDFVRKYSRKSRPARPVVDPKSAPAASPTADIDFRSTASSPVVSAASRYQHLRSPVLASPTECDSAETKHHNDSCVGSRADFGAASATKTDNHHNIPTQQDGDVRTTTTDQRLTEQFPVCGTSGGWQDVTEMSHGDRLDARLDAKSTKSGDAKRAARTGPRAGTGLFRSESDSSKMRSLKLQSLRPKAMTSVSQLPPQPPTTAARFSPLVGNRVATTSTTTNSGGSTDRGGVETDDEGVGAVDIDEPSFKDTYTLVTTAGGGGTSANRSALPPNLRQYRDTQLLPGSVGGRHQRSAEHSGPINETSATSSGTISGGDVLSGVTATPKMNGSGRFLTHPPLRERSVTREPGSVDSNGLGALRDVSDPAKQTQYLDSQVSVSSGDSHICPSEDSASLSYFGGDGNADSSTTATTDTSSSADQLVRKNSKTQKQKSRSDPTRGEKNGDGSAVVDIPSIVSGTMHAQSSPVLLDDDKEDRRESSTTHFTFTTDSASASDLSDRGGVGAGGNDGVETTVRSDHHILAASTAGDNSARLSPSSAMQDVAVRVVLKSDDSFEELPPTSIKPPRPKSNKKRPRAPPSPLTTPTTAAAESSSSASSLVRKVFSKDRGSPASGRLQAKNGDGDGSQSELSTAASASSLTIPHGKKSSLSRSHSSAGNGAVSGSGGSVASERSKHAQHPQLLVIARQRSPGAPDAPDVVPRTGVVSASASVPELCNASSGRLLHDKDTYIPSLEPVLSGSTVSLFDGPAGDKVTL